jgi:hypothetical protein
VAEANGKVLYCIGSSLGLRMAAKIYCPASSIFSSDQDCLYFADYEKHALGRQTWRREQFKHSILHQILNRDLVYGNS